MFEVGDKVIRKESDDSEYLTKGKIYTIKGITKKRASGEVFVFLEEDPMGYGFYLERFDLYSAPSGLDKEIFDIKTMGYRVARKK